MQNQYTKSLNGLLEYKKYHYFYKITNLLNGKYYYGIHSTNDLNDKYKGSGVRLHEAYKKYGIKNFKKEILKYFDTRKEASKYESQIITEDEINSDKCYNLTTGGDKGICNAFKGKHHLLKTKEIVSKKLTIPDDKLVLKRRIMHKGGIKKSIKIEDIQRYKEDGWILGGSNSSYLHNKKEYLDILKEKKRKRIEKENQKSLELSKERLDKDLKVKNAIQQVIDSIDTSKYGWISNLIRATNYNYTKKIIMRIMKLHFNDIYIKAYKRKSIIK